MNNLIVWTGKTSEGFCKMLVRALQPGKITSAKYRGAAQVQSTVSLQHRRLMSGWMSLMGLDIICGKGKTDQILAGLPHTATQEGTRYSGQNKSN